MHKISQRCYLWIIKVHHIAGGVCKYCCFLLLNLPHLFLAFNFLLIHTSVSSVCTPPPHPKSSPPPNEDSESGWWWGWPEEGRHTVFNLISHSTSLFLSLSLPVTASLLLWCRYFHQRGGGGGGFWHSPTLGHFSTQPALCWLQGGWLDWAREVSKSQR